MPMIVVIERIVMLTWLEIHLHRPSVYVNNVYEVSYTCMSLGLMVVMRPI